jgi:hypothetical protein
MNAFPLEIELVDKKEGIVVDPPKVLISWPLMLETKSIAVDKLLVETDADVVIPELLRVVVVVVFDTVKLFVVVLVVTVKLFVVVLFGTVKKARLAVPDVKNEPA